MKAKPRSSVGQWTRKRCLLIQTSSSSVTASTHPPGTASPPPRLPRPPHRQLATAASNSSASGCGLTHRKRARIGLSAQMERGKGPRHAPDGTTSASSPPAASRRLPLLRRGSSRSRGCPPPTSLHTPIAYVWGMSFANKIQMVSVELVLFQLTTI